MKASEANLIAKAKVLSDFNKQFDKVIIRVKNNAENGYFEYRCCDNISESVKNHLLELGYFMEENKDGSTIIYWK